MGQIDSVYRETAIALHGCGKAEVRLRQNQPEEALADLHRSWRIAREFPNMMAHKRLLTRTLAQMAWAYAALGDRTKAEQLLNDASKHFESALANPGGMIHGVATFDLCHPMAIAYWHLNHPEAARAMFARAVEKGWRDAEWMESDPELKQLLATPDLDSVLDRIRQFPALHFGAGIEVVGPGG
jgi:tetratricopeptide (TPR) repeat protein